MSARVNFFSSQSQHGEYKNSIFVDKDALTVRDNKQIVFRVNGELADIVEIKIGRELGDHVEITSGLSINDRVVLSPPGKMVDGEKVEITK